MPSAKRARSVAAALDELDEPAATERAQRRVDGEAARAARELRHPVDLVAHALRAVVLDQVGRADRHRRAMRLRVRRRGRCPSRRGRSATCARRSSTSPPARRRATRWRSRGETAAQSPNAPSTCSHAPCGLARHRRSRRQRVERAGVHLARLRADDRRPVSAASAVAQRVGAQPSLRRRLRRPSGAPRPSRRSARSTVTCRFSPTSTRTRGAPARPSRADVPADRVEHVEARGRERR